MQLGDVRQAGSGRERTSFPFFYQTPRLSRDRFFNRPADLDPGTGYIIINSSLLFIQIHFLHSSNRQCLSYLLPLCKNESTACKCKIIHMTSTTGYYSFLYVKCFARRLVLKQRQKKAFILELLTGAFD